MAKKRTCTGINVQFPISQLIITGEKTIETRKYPIPPQFINQEMALIETPGKDGDFQARIIGMITFSNSFQYSNESEFYKDTKRHCVTPHSPWAWQKDKPKWGWEISIVKRFSKPISAPKNKGIKYTNGIEI